MRVERVSRATARATPAKCRWRRWLKACFVLSVCGSLLACEAPWYVRPEAPSRLEYLSGHRTSYRVCLRPGEKPIRAVELEAIRHDASRRARLRARRSAPAHFFAAMQPHERSIANRRSCSRAQARALLKRIPLTSATREPGALFAGSRPRLAWATSSRSPAARGLAAAPQHHLSIAFRRCASAVCSRRGWPERPACSALASWQT